MNKILFTHHDCGPPKKNFQYQTSNYCLNWQAFCLAFSSFVHSDFYELANQLFMLLSSGLYGGAGDNPAHGQGLAEHGSVRTYPGTKTVAGHPVLQLHL